MTTVTGERGFGAYPRSMDVTDPILLVAAIAVVAAILTPLASRLIGSAAGELSAELDSSGSDLDTSRIRPRRHR